MDAYGYNALSGFLGSSNIKQQRAEELRYLQAIRNLQIQRQNEENALEQQNQQYLDAAALDPNELKGIIAKVVMLHGRDDKPCPASETTMVLARSIPASDIHLLGNCGHNLPRERPNDYLTAAIQLFETGN